MSIIAAYRDLSDSARRHMSTQPTGCGSTGGITDRVVPTYKVVPIESTAPRRTIVRTCVDAANRSGLGTLSNRAETEPPLQRHARRGPTGDEMRVAEKVEWACGFSRRRYGD